MSRLTINSNIAALNAQRNLDISSKKVTDIYTRLSSGLRINKASDDAAGLSISESLKTDVRLFNQGIRNLNDGLSLLSIADGALGELSGITIRLNELAEQASNGTLGKKQRDALDQEAQALSKEFNRIARSTQFNGMKLFDGDFGQLSLVAGGGSESIIMDSLGGIIGDGSFAEFVSVPTVGAATGVTTADINGDGLPDLITSNGGQKINVIMNTGNGTFASPVSYYFGMAALPWRINTADMNNDGIDDIIASDLSSNVSVLINRGDGTFLTPQTYSTGGSYNVNPNQIVIGDFNNDNIMDVITSNEAVRVFVFCEKRSMQNH